MAKNRKTSKPGNTKTTRTSNGRSLTTRRSSNDTKSSQRSVAQKASKLLVTGKDKRFVKSIAAGRIVGRDTVAKDKDIARHVESANTHLLKAWHTIHESHTKRPKAS
jgi:hypothetical protein